MSPWVNSCNSAGPVHCGEKSQLLYAAILICRCVSRAAGKPRRMSEVLAHPLVCKVRLRFTKTGDMRFLSHHDLMRLLERLSRRADLPIRHTEGFNPKAKITFASALGLGITGREEVVEIELDGDISGDDVITRLNPLLPEGIQLLSGRQVPVKKTVQPVQALYFLPLPSEFRPALQAQLEHQLQQSSLVIDRLRNVLQAPADSEPLAEERLDALTNAAPVTTRVEVKKLDIRPFIHKLWRDDAGYWMDVAITNHGAIRPEELLRLVDLEDYWLDGEAILERVKLVVEDEVSAEQALSYQPEASARPDLAATQCEASPAFASD